MQVEHLFHFSVAKWLGINGYKFFYELPLPNSKLRPDFLAVSRTGEKMIIECKMLDKGFVTAPINQLKKYGELLGDSDVTLCIVVPDDVPMVKGLPAACKRENIRLICIKNEMPTPFHYMRFSGYQDTVGKYFPTYLKPIPPPVINKWGRFLLD